MNSSIITNIFWIIELLIIARVFLSWIPVNINYKIKQFIFDLTEPLLSPFKKLIPPPKFGFDFSPILAFLSLEVLKQILLNLLSL